MDNDGVPELPSEEDVPVLGPEHEIHEELGELPKARVLEVDLEPADELEPVPASVEAERAEDEAALSDSRNLLAIYQAKFAAESRDARAELARRAQGNELLALCLDPDPRVIDAVLQNATSGLAHARLAARHHKNPAGLEFIVKRAPLLRDTQVQRALLANDQLSDGLLRRVLGQKPLRELYRAATNREIPERNRLGSRGVLRTRFASAQPEERVEFIVTTEGRCLAYLSGATFDGKTTAMLCARQYNSTLFVQNLARFSACPPLLLIHLSKQPFVKRSQALKRMLLQHPNMPTQVKRGL
jgi:hypothetical protein